MAYHLNKHGETVEEDLNKVEERRVYPEASTTEAGVMTPNHVQRLQTVEQEVSEESETLTEFEILMICR